MSDDPLEQLDYYTLLQVPEDSNADQVRQGFHRFAAKYHPDRFSGAGADPKKVERAAQIYRRGAEAYKVLTDPRRRKLYDAGLAEGRVRFDPAAEPPPAPVNIHTWPIKVKTPLARPFAIKAEQLYKAGDWGNAKTNIKLALQKDKGNAQLEALLADVDQRLGVTAAAAAAPAGEAPPAAPSEADSNGAS
jgi:curved DNA-binding protein CbpA